jgi:hypothetical protein
MSGVHPTAQQMIDALCVLGTYKPPDQRAQEDLDLLFASLSQVFLAVGRSRSRLADRHARNSFLHPVVTQFMAEVGNSYARVANRCAELYIQWRTHHQHDLARVESPRPDEPKTNVR